MGLVGKFHFTSEEGQMSRKSLIWLGVVIAATVLIAGGYYWFSQEKPEPGFTGVRENVTICYATPLSALVTIADEQGFFSQNGLDAILKQYPLGKMSLERMFNGECDIATAGETPIMFNSFNRADFGIISTISTSDNFAKIVARRDVWIQNPQDLRGKRIATQKGTQLHFFLHVFLVKNSISDEQVNILFKNADELPDALKKGEIDAFSMGEPYISRAKKLLGGNAVVLTSPGISHTSSNLVAFNGFIKNKPEAIKRTLRSLILAEEFAKKHPDESIKILSKKHGIEESEMTAFWTDVDWKVSLEQSLLLVLEDEARWAITNNLTNKTKVPNYLNFTYAESLEAVKPEAVTIIH